MKLITLLTILPLLLFAVELPNFNNLTQTQKEALQHVASQANKFQTNTVWTARSYYDGVVVAHATNEVTRVLGNYVGQHQSARDASISTNVSLSRIRSRLSEILNSPSKVNRIEAILDE